MLSIAGVVGGWEDEGMSVMVVSEAREAVLRRRLARDLVGEETRWVEKESDSSWSSSTSGSAKDEDVSGEKVFNSAPYE